MIQNTIDSRTHEGELNKRLLDFHYSRIYVIRCTLFATLLTLQHGGDYAGKMTTELFELPLVLIMTFCIIIPVLTHVVLLFTTCAKKTKLMMFWMIITLLLGLVFVGFEIYEFAHYASEGVNPTIGSYWSSFFILLGTHGLSRNFRYRLGPFVY